MKSEGLGILSALTASVCCIGPLLLAVAGLGGLGAGALIGAFHWYFIAAGVVLLGMGWWTYLRERRRCQTERCEMARGRLSQITLSAATVAVVGFLALNLYTYAGQPLHGASAAGVTQGQVVIPVEGMTCFSCTVHVEQSLKALDGVRAVHASVPHKSVAVSFDPARITVSALVQAINETGYRAAAPSGSSG